MIMAVDTGTMTVFQLIEAIPPYIEGRGYSKSYVDGIKEVFNNLNQYCVHHVSGRDELRVYPPVLPGILLCKVLP